MTSVDLSAKLLLTRGHKWPFRCWDFEKKLMVGKNGGALSTNAITFPRSSTKEVSVSKSWLREPFESKWMRTFDFCFHIHQILHFTDEEKTRGAPLIVIISQPPLNTAEFTENRVGPPSNGALTIAVLLQHTADIATIQQRALVISLCQGSKPKFEHGSFCS